MNFPPTYYRTTTKPVMLTKHAISKRLVFCSLNSTLPEIVNWSGVTNLLLYGQYRFSMLSKWVNGSRKRCNMNLNLNENSFSQACLKWSTRNVLRKPLFYGGGAWVEHTGCANCGPFPIIHRSWKSTISFFFKYLYSGSDHPFNPPWFQWTKCLFCDWICKIMYSDHTIVLTYIFHPPWKNTKILKISHSVFEQEHCLLIVTNKLHYVYAWFIINQIIFAWKFKDFFKTILISSKVNYFWQGSIMKANANRET